MKPVLLISSILAASLAISAPTIVFAHVGHGDEFQATGGVDRVKVNPETDPMLGDESGRDGAVQFPQGQSPV